MTFVETRTAVYERDGGVCHICGGVIPTGGEFHIDHLVPRSQGGSNHIDNLALAHPGCNMRRGNKSLADSGSSKTQVVSYFDPSEVAVIAEYARDHQRSLAFVVRMAVCDFFGV